MTAETRRAMARLMTEDELLTAITEAATMTGWRWMHIRRSDLAIVQGHSGFPDLILARDGRVMYLELKTMTGDVTPDQAAWLVALDNGDVWATVVRPVDLDDVIAALSVTRGE